MNGKEASEFVGITYKQMRYFVEQIAALTKKETSQGHDHEFGFRDLVYLKLAAFMRADGLRLDEINKAIEQLNFFWEIPEFYGNGALVKNREGEWRYGFNDNYIAGETYYFDPEKGKEGNYVKTALTRVPRFFYNVSAIVDELAKDNQLTFEFANSEMEAMKGN